MLQKFERAFNTNKPLMLKRCFFLTVTWYRCKFFGYLLTSNGTKIKKHCSSVLSFVRSEYVKLQQKCSSLERENALLSAQVGGRGGGHHQRPQDSFVGRLVATVAGLYNKPLYSDLTILTTASSLYAHKFVLR
jgi:hypothetical protein